MKPLAAVKAMSILLLLIPFCNTSVVAQAGITDTFLYKKAVYNALAVYHQAIGDQLGLYNGTQYANYSFTFADGKHPFFNASAFSAGSIVYDGALYTDIHLLYDEVAGVLIFQDSMHRLQLHNERVAEFTILDNHFIRLEKEGLNNDDMPSGFYQVLYNGTTQVLKREIKTITQDISSIAVGVVGNVKVKTLYFIKKDNTSFSIKKENDLFDVFKGRENDLQQYIKVHVLRFKKDIDNTLVQVAAYYDQLTK